ncbi:hypothetical protein GCM10027094_40300 [Hafnia psychrotolerans]
MRVTAAITVSLALLNERLYSLRLTLPRAAFTGGLMSIVTDKETVLCHSEGIMGFSAHRTFSSS